MNKNPKRWDEKIISTPFATLTKKDVFDYYDNPAVKNQILRSANGGETIIRQSFKPGQDILRRKDTAGDLIHLTSKKYDEFNDVRMSEIHPTFGRKVDFILADVDPKGKVPWQKTKAIAETIAKTMQTHPAVKKVDVRFSGGRGFYIRGQLGETMGINAARNMTKQILDGIARRPDVTFGIPQAGQIRIDTTPLKYRGSVRAPYSLNAQTGLVSAPVSLSKLPRMQKTDYTVGKVLKGIKKKAEAIAATRPLLEREKEMTGPTGTLEEPTKKVWKDSLDAADAPVEPIVLMGKTAKEKEFAPGIPGSRKTQPIPKLENKSWMMSIQKHYAHRAGTHYDLRLVDPKTNQAHSFAVPQARLPRHSDRMLLAIQQPTHTANYALNFKGEIPKGTYGAGKVTMPFKEPIEVIKSTADKIKFQRENGQKFVLFRTETEGPKWGFKRLK